MRTSSTAPIRRTGTRSPGRLGAPLSALVVMLAVSVGVTACSDEEPPDVPGAAGQTDASTAQPGAGPDAPAAEAPELETDASTGTDLSGQASPSATPASSEVSFTRRPYAPDDRFVAQTRLELKLDATIGMGFLSQEVTYRREEKELLAVTILPDDENGNLRRTLEFEQRQTTTTLPIVGEETDDRRAAGKTFTVTSTADGDVIVNDRNGKEANEKLAREVGYSLQILGHEPVFFAVLPEGEQVSLAPGTVLDVESELARRIVGLPFEELGVDSLQLTLRQPESLDDPLATFDTKALFSGDAILGDSHLRMKAKLHGTVVVVRDTMRLASVELKGHVNAQHEAALGSEEGLLSAKGDGPLKIKRKITDG